MLFPLRTMGPLVGRVATAFVTGPGGHGGSQFYIMHVHSRVRKIGQSTGMVRVEMRRDDVSNVFGLVPESQDLRNRGVPAELRTNQGPEPPWRYP
jgi:hypothetical protein